MLETRLGLEVKGNVQATNDDLRIQNNTGHPNQNRISI